MSFTLPSKLGVGEGVTKDDWDAIIDALSNLDGRVALSEGVGIVNGSFEQDDDSDNIPDGWTLVSTATSYGLDDSNDSSGDSVDGRYSFKVVTSILSQQVTLTSDTVRCAPGQRIEVDGWVKASANDIGFEIEVLYFQENGTTASSVNAGDTLFESGRTGVADNTPTSWKRIRSHETVVPSDARFYSVRITLGNGLGWGTIRVDGFSSKVYKGIRLCENHLLANIVEGGATTVNIHNVGSPVGDEERPVMALIEIQDVGSISTSNIDIEGSPYSDGASTRIKTFDHRGDLGETFVAKTRVWVYVDNDGDFVSDGDNNADYNVYLIGWQC